MAGTVTQRLWCKRAAKADLLIKGARVVDPEAGVDDVMDVLTTGGRVAAFGRGLEPGCDTAVRDADGCLLLPGFVDLHAHFRVPGGEDAEDLTAVTEAAASGGYVAAFGMANTHPVVDNAALLKRLARRAQAEASVPVGFHAAVTPGLKGERLTEMAELATAGAVAFSDDGMPVADASLLRRALHCAKATGRHIAIHAEDRSLTRKATMHEGSVSARLGQGGMPSIAESIEVGRALEVAAYENARLHVCHVSTAASLEHLVRFRRLGAPVTSEVCPHHLTLTDDAVVTLDPNLKMNPPLRPESDRAALVAALADGLIDCVATDHAPHRAEDKEAPFAEAPFGVVGLATAFAVLYDALVRTGALDLNTLVTRMSSAPARIAGIPGPTIRQGAEANFCLFDPDETWTVSEHALRSRSHNSPWLGRELRGRVVLTAAAGRIAWDAGA